MAGTRTAPAVNGTPVFKGLTIHLVDASGDNFTDYIKVAAAATPAQMEAAVAAYQAGTNASVWNVTVSDAYEGSQDPDNAVAAYRAGVQNGINMLMKDASLNTITPRLIAPVASTLQGNQDIPLLQSGDPAANTPLGDLVVAYLAAVGGSYGLDSVQYTARRERRNNPRIKT